MLHSSYLLYSRLSKIVRRLLFFLYMYIATLTHGSFCNIKIKQLTYLKRTYIFGYEAAFDESESSQNSFNWKHILKKIFLFIFAFLCIYLCRKSKKLIIGSLTAVLHPLLPVPHSPRSTALTCIASYLLDNPNNHTEPREWGKIGVTSGCPGREESVTDGAGRARLCCV
jgi:hypothetical protein